MKKLVSVVVLNWNGKNHLKICLDSLKKLTYKPIEVIVVDNNSHDGSPALVKKKYSWVKLIKNKKNVGYATGNNIGIKKSSGEFVFILNNDTKVTKDFLEPLVADMRFDKRIACVQPKLVYATKPEVLNAVGSYFTSSGFLYHYGYRKPANLSKYNKKLFIYSAKGAAMLLRKSALNKVGLFDDDFFIFFEETDLCHRFWLSGFKVLYEPSSLVYHFEAVDTSRQMKEFARNFLSLRNRICSYAKNLEGPNLIKIMIFLSIIYALSFIYSLIRFRFEFVFALIMSLLWNMYQLPNTLKKRYTIQLRMREIKDNDLFKVIKKNPPIRYYYYLFFDNLKNFTNEKAV